MRIKVKKQLLKKRKKINKTMKLNIISKEEQISDNLINIKGGIEKGLMDEATTCTCDCWISNKNEETPSKGKGSLQKGKGHK
jgi:hypothetical protein